MSSGVAPAADDNLMSGCMLGCLCQVGFFVLGAVFAYMQNNGRLIKFAFAIWGVTQWIAIVPLIIRQRAAGYPARAKGLLMAGCLGVLLSSACALLTR